MSRQSAITQVRSHFDSGAFLDTLSLPGLAPTGKYFEVPMLAVVCFRGDKLYNEHIYWDQASVLVQIGVLDPTGLPVSGIQSAKKLIDESLPTNTLMSNWSSSENKPV